MATTITDDCINCGACEPECPNNAISQGEPIYVIDPLLCTECVGFHDYEACAAVCPVDCCVTDPNNVETEEVLIARAKSLHPEVAFGGDFPSRFRKTDAAPGAASAGATEENTAEPSVSKAATEEVPAIPLKPTTEPAAANLRAQTTVSQSTPQAKTEQSDVRAASAEEAGTQPSVSKAATEEVPAIPPKPTTEAAAGARTVPQPPASRSTLQAGAGASGVNAQATEQAETQPSAPKAAPEIAPVAPSKPAAAKAVPEPAVPEKKPQAKSKKTFANELPVSFAEVERQFNQVDGPLATGIARWMLLLLQPALGSLPHESKKRLEAAVQNHLFFSTAGSTGLNILGNMILYPVIGMVLAAVLKSPAVIFSKEVNIYLLTGMIVALAEGVFRLREGIFRVKPPEETKFPAAIYGAILGKLLEPILAKQTSLIRDRPVPVDGFYSKGFVDKLERERRYGNVYTVEDRGGAFLLRLEFPRWMPDIGLPARSQIPDELPDYDYDLALKDGQFIVKGICSDERVRKISSSVGAFPPEFTTVIPLREKVVGFTHQFKNKLLEVFLVKEKDRS